jgi:hypothetical protein
VSERTPRLHTFDLRSNPKKRKAKRARKPAKKRARKPAKRKARAKAKRAASYVVKFYRTPADVEKDRKAMYLENMTRLSHKKSDAARFPTRHAAEKLTRIMFAGVARYYHCAKIVRA